MKYEAILFDADGTLFDYDKAEEIALKNTLEKYGIQMTSKIHLLYRKINQSKWELFEQGLISKSKLQVSRFSDLFKAIKMENTNADDFNTDYLAYLAGGSQLIDGAFKICSELSKTKKLAIITNGVAKTQFRRIDKSSIKSFISDVFVSEEIGFAKPDVRYFDYVFERMKLSDKSLVLIVGDSLKADIQGGLNYGIVTCYFNPKRNENNNGITPQYEIESLSEFLDFEL